jgi:hypothetical protein
MKEEALLKIECDHVDQLLHPSFSKEALVAPLYKDNTVVVVFAGGPGAAVEKSFLTPKKQKRAAAKTLSWFVRSLLPRMLVECGPLRVFSLLVEESHRVSEKSTGLSIFEY